MVAFGTLWGCLCMFLDFTWIAFLSRGKCFLWVSSTHRLVIIQFSQVLPLHQSPGHQDPCWQAVRIALVSLLSRGECKHSLEATQSKIRVPATYWTKISVFSAISITFWNAIVLTIVSAPTLLGGLFFWAQFLRVKQKEDFPGDTTQESASQSKTNKKTRHCLSNSLPAQLPLGDLDLNGYCPIVKSRNSKSLNHRTYSAIWNSGLKLIPGEKRRKYL